MEQRAANVVWKSKMNVCQSELWIVQYSSQMDIMMSIYFNSQPFHKIILKILSKETWNPYNNHRNITSF